MNLSKFPLRKQEAVVAVQVWWKDSELTTGSEGAQACYSFQTAQIGIKGRYSFHTMRNPFHSGESIDFVGSPSIIRTPHHRLCP